MTDDDAGSYNLIDHPWILARRLDGNVEELSILDTVGQAHELAGIVGELPTQTFAITRLLLAILHRAVAGPVDVAHWKELWAEPELPVADVHSYLGQHRDRFDLLHPRTPFYQVAGLHTAKDETFGLERLIADAPTGKPYFTTRLGAGLATIGLAEAARWVVHCQAFDPSGIKSGAVGDPRVKNGKGYPIGVAWTGAIGGVLCEGETLRETLLLNLVAESRSYLPTDPADLPVWERDQQTAQEEVIGGRGPYGPLDLYTWQSRRIRLVVRGGQATGVLICNGDKLEPLNLHTREPMTAWRRSANQEKQRGQQVVYMPLTHEPARAFWRGIAALLPSRAGRQQGHDGAYRLVPAVLQWISELRNEQALLDDRMIRTRAIGMQYINQRTLAGEIIDDALAMRVVVLSETSVYLGEQIAAAAESAERGARALGDLAATLAQAAGGDRDGPKARAQESAYAALDEQFRSWLAGLDAVSDLASTRAAWNQEAHDILGGLGRDLIESSGPQAWIGHHVSVKGKEYLMCTPKAEARFRRDLSAIFALANSDAAVPEGVPA